MEYSLCDLSDDLLVKILLLVPTKDAVSTTFLSKRWRYVWTMLPKLEYIEEKREKAWCFIEESLKLHKAPKLNDLRIKLGPSCPSNINVGNWVEIAVNRGVSFLDFDLAWTAEPTSFPKSLYTCETLVYLILSHEILVDVSSHAHLPSLKSLHLKYVVYKDENSLVKLLSSSNVLEKLFVERHKNDNLLNFIVKVPSLKLLFYTTKPMEEEDDDDLTKILVIDSPAISSLYLIYTWEDNIFIKNVSCLNVAYITSGLNFDEKNLSFLSSVKNLKLLLYEPMVEIHIPSLSFFLLFC